MRLYDFTIVMVRLQGLVLLISLIYDLGYVPQYVEGALKIDVFGNHYPKLMQDALEFAYRQAVYLVFGFSFLFGAKYVAAILVRNLPVRAD